MPVPVSACLQVGADSGAADAQGRDVLTAACHSRNLVAAALILQTIHPPTPPALILQTIHPATPPNADAASASVLLAMDMVDSFRRTVVIPSQNLAGEGSRSAALPADTSGAGAVVTWTWTSSDADSLALSKSQSPAAGAGGQGTANSSWMAAQNAEMGGPFFRLAMQ